MKIDQINPATVEYIKTMQHYDRLLTEKRSADIVEENRKRENARRVQETGKGQHVDVMV